MLGRSLWPVLRLPIYVGHKRAVLAFGSLEKGHRLFARWSDGWFKAALGKGVLNHTLYLLIIFNDQDNNQLFQLCDSPNAQRQLHHAEVGDSFRSKCTKVNLGVLTQHSVVLLRTN